ncbi:unnamed protein product [Pleuronectes platessa]|uniref:Uncharacterized protein n=1 Tax=Pleuronectes platessa TaxID=8262 RepID=A0A9N7UE18_PLEPL|nr:unnamed protein product [Pleuronectes platessa]
MRVDIPKDNPNMTCQAVPLQSQSMVSNQQDHDPPSRPDATPVLSHSPPPPSRTHHEPPTLNSGSGVLYHFVPQTQEARGGVVAKRHGGVVAVTQDDAMTRAEEQEDEDDDDEEEEDEDDDDDYGDDGLSDADSDALFRVRGFLSVIPGGAGDCGRWSPGHSQKRQNFFFMSFLFQRDKQSKSSRDIPKTLKNSS